MSHLLKIKFMRPILLMGIFTFCLMAKVSSQMFNYENYQWDEKVTPYILPDSLNEESAVFIKHHKLNEFNPSIASEKSLLTILHTRIYLNNDKAIEQNNKIYIDQSNNADVKSINLRIIQPNGSIRELDNSNIKKGKDEETEIEYSYYAVDGLEIGSEIESVVILQQTPSLYGQYYPIQRAYPILDFKFEYISPHFLEFDFKTYNSSIKGVNRKEEKKEIWLAEGLNIPKEKTEAMSFKNANKQYLVFKLDANPSKNLQDLNGFGYYSQIIGQRGLNFEHSKSELKSLQKIYKSLNINDALTNTEKVLKIEHYIKTNFAFIDNTSNEELEVMGRILVNKAFNSFGAIKIYNYLFQSAGLSCSVVFTCDKSRFTFDEDFETYLFLNKMLLYVNEIETPLDPSDEFSRLKYFDTNYQGHKGLFVKSRKVGTVITASGKVKEIPSTSAIENLTKATIDLKLSDEFSDMEILVEKQISGHVAKNFQPIFSVVPDEKIADFHEYVIYAYPGQFIASSVVFENIAKEDFPILPLIGKFELKSDEFWEKAGKNYILKVGALIGPQSQMYNEEKTDRTFEIQSDFARRYQYEISFNIPESYDAQNLEDLNMNFEDSMGGNKFYFKSNYTIEGNSVTVTIDEIYDSANYPASVFESYQSVINAAADFNKVNIIFKQK